MAELVTLTQQVTPQPVTTPAEMGEAAVWATTLGYRAVIQADVDRSGNTVLGIELNHNINGQQCIAALGDVLIWNGAVLTKMSAAEYEAQLG